jgi:hypothetical protein
VTRLAVALAIVLAFAPAARAQLPMGGITSPNVQFVKNFVTSTDSSGARLKDGYFYITTERDLTIYDVRDPENPVQVGHLLFTTSPGTPVYTEEDPDTNGRILLTWNGNALQVIDVSDKTNPHIVGTVDGPDQHTISCALDCTWAYGTEGEIVDLRDPAHPRIAGNWNDQLSPDSTHDVTEVSPGILLTATEPMMLLDIRADPAHPKLLASTDMPGFTHAVRWPGAGTDDFALVGGEAQATPDCSQDASATFQTFDTRGWQDAHTFRLIDQFRMSNGTETDGRSPYTTWCVHWFQEHPSFHDGGLVAIAWYEHGVRFLQIGTDGKIKEVGYYLPYLGQSSGAYWITDRILYTADYYRGMDILKFTGDIPQGRPPAAPGAPPPAPAPAPAASAPPVSFDSLVTLPPSRRCVRAVRVRVRSKGVRSLVAFVDGRRRAASRGRSLTLRRLPHRRFSLQVVVRTRSGHQTAGQRFYRGCA